MYIGLFHTHSFLRYFVLVFLILVIVISLIGWISKKHYTKFHKHQIIILLVLAHLQLLVGLTLYFLSPLVQFGSETMGNDELRYWTLEHILMMIIAVVLITFSRVISKKAKRSTQKFKRLFIINLTALIIIIAGILLSGRGLI